MKSEQQPIVPKEPHGEHLYSDDGVDLTLIRWMLSLTPTERLRVLQRNIQAVLRMRRAAGLEGYPGWDKD